MKRRDFLKSAAGILAFPILCPRISTNLAEAAARTAARRVRPEDPLWPSPAKWESLRREVGGRLIKIESPLTACKYPGHRAACSKLLTQLKNPYYIGDQPALTQNSGWVDAWRSRPSVYAVAATNTQDVVAAVNFAREHNLRIVIKGGGHSYQGTSNAADSLLIWTRAMNRITLHEVFVAKGCARNEPPQHAVTVEAGAIWMHTYDAVTTKTGRYVQGGGCATVGVAGLIQSGGFGSFSKRYGLAAAGLLEAEVVTADGTVRLANSCQNSDLFWGIKGGGGGSLGVVTKVTLRTRELPEYFGGAFGAIKATSDAAFRELIANTMTFYNDALFNPHWGEQIAFAPGNIIRIQMVFQGLNRQQALNIWEPFIRWVTNSPGNFSFEQPMTIDALPARHFWDAEFWKRNFPAYVVSDERPEAPKSNIFWVGNRDEVGQTLHGYKSAWLPASLLQKVNRQRLADALFASTRHWQVSLHFNKGLAGAPPDEIAAAKQTAMNPAVLNAFALAICASGGPPAFPGVLGHSDLVAARRNARKVGKAMDALLKVSPNAGSYVSESDFFERDWQQVFWGSNYRRLAAVKKKYDPSGLFFVHHGVGSEDWSADGFVRQGGR